MARDKAERSKCSVTMISKAEPSHTHTCGGNHEVGKSHKCDEPKCARHFWKKGELA